MVDLNGKSFMPSRHSLHRDSAERPGSFIRALRSALMGRDPHAVKNLAQTAATGLGRGVVKGAVILSLVGVGVVVPLTAHEDVTEPSQREALLAQRVDDGVGPGILEVLQGQSPTQVLSVSISPVITVSNPMVYTSTRDFDKELLPKCNTEQVISSSNGKLTNTELCELPWNRAEKLFPRAAASLAALNEAFNLEFNRDICISSSYRSYADQKRVKANRGDLAAAPGTSNHGLGLAIDLCGTETGSRKVWTWIQKNGPVYGWVNPAWAKRGGGGPYEPWHWEFEDEVLKHK